MKCIVCGREIPENSIFCNWCGEKQIKEKRRRAKKKEIKVPKPVQLKSGSWNIYLRAEGVSVTEETAAKCEAKARAIRAGFIEKKKSPVVLTVETAIQQYLDSSSSVLSPSTQAGYISVSKHHFQDYMKSDITKVDWQKAVNEESKSYSPKTVSNAWALMARVMGYHGLDVPTVRLPQKTVKEMPWLNYKQILIFVEAIRGEECEIAALLALHSLRKSELLAITPRKVDSAGIHVSGAKVRGPDSKLVEKETNKNASSTRVVPIMIPRLRELMEGSGKGEDEPYVSIGAGWLHERINKICRKNGLPEVGVHGLRRSFASLAYHLGWQERKTMAIGGWSSFQTMHKLYIKLDSSDLESAADSMTQFYKDGKITDENTE